MNIARHLLFVFVLLVTACRKNDVYTPRANPGSFLQVFDDFWHGMSVNYLYWNIDTTQWDETYYRYRPLFAQLDWQKESDQKRSIALFREMTKGLIDGHYYIDFTAPAIKDSFVYTAFERKIKQADFHYPYPYASVTKQYLDAGFYEGSDNTTTPGDEPVYALCGTIRNRFLYFYCNRFALQRSWAASNNNSIKPLLVYFFGLLHQLPSHIEKVIIDVRGNRGGDIGDLNFIAGQLTGSPLPFGYTRYKSNSGRLDYTPWVQAVVTPQPGAQMISRPVVVLADHFSASLSELLAIAVHSLPKGKVIGEPTFGATGPLTSHDLYNDGSFDVNGFMHVQTASAQFKYLDNRMFEGTGFPPDITIPFDFITLQTGRDPALEKAMDE